MQKLTNLLALLAVIILFIVAIAVAIHSIDSITKRDCARGIVVACKYINH